MSCIFERWLYFAGQGYMPHGQPPVSVSPYPQGQYPQVPMKQESKSPPAAPTPGIVWYFTYNSLKSCASQTYSYSVSKRFKKNVRVTSMNMNYFTVELGDIVTLDIFFLQVRSVGCLRLWTLWVKVIALVLLSSQSPTANPHPDLRVEDPQGLHPDHR